jgi:transaldolase
VLSSGGGDAEETIFKFRRLGIDVSALGADLQKEGADSFVKSWNEMMGVVATKAQSLK